MKYRNISDPRFKLVTDFSVRAPKDYGHFMQMGAFRRKFGPGSEEPVSEKVYKIEEGFDDESLSNATFRLRNGKTSLVVIFAVMTKITSDEALDFARRLGADFVNGQGLTLLWPQARVHLPTTSRIFSLDNRECLPTVPLARQWDGPYKIDKKVALPYLFVYSGEDVGFHFQDFDAGLDEKCSIALFKQET